MDRNTEKSPIRVWCDGCYDLVHFGHANSFRQAKKFGNYVIVGVHSDEDLIKHKGLPVYTSKERCKMLKAIKWVDEVIENSPYITTLDILNQYKCDYCCHGNDITVTIDGIDTYEQIKNTGRYKEIRRTEGISTTGLVKRVLKSVEHKQTPQKLLQQETPTSPWTGSTFLLTTKKLIEFVTLNNQTPKLNDKIVYVDGTFDMYHIGHVEFLKKAKTFGDYLIVGIYADRVVNELKGKYPIMCFEERVMNILSCKYVSDVILGAPYIITKDLIEHFHVDIVVVGNCRKHYKIDNEFDPYKYPKQLNKFIVVDSGCDVTTEEIVQRIIKNRNEFEKRNTIKEEKELKLINSTI